MAEDPYQSRQKLRRRLGERRSLTPERDEFDDLLSETNYLVKLLRLTGSGGEWVAWALKFLVILVIFAAIILASNLLSSDSEDTPIDGATQADQPLAEAPTDGQDTPTDGAAPVDQPLAEVVDAATPEGSDDYVVPYESWQFTAGPFYFVGDDRDDRWQLRLYGDGVSGELWPIFGDGWVTSGYTIENGVYRFRTDKEEINEVSGIEYASWNVFELTRQGDMLVGTANSSSWEIGSTHLGGAGEYSYELIDHGPISIPTAATLLWSADEEG